MNAFKALAFLIMIAGAVFGETNSSLKMTFPRWGPSLRAGSVYNFKTDIDAGGEFSVNRYFMEVGMARMWSFDKMISFSFGFGQDDYQFSGLTTEPWNNIENYRAGLFCRWTINDKWKVIGGPSIRSYAETGADLKDALTGAFFGGASYVFSERLSLGPGFGVVDQINGDTRFFPVVLVNWNITEHLSLRTGGGLAATGGPGLSLNYEFSKRWQAGLSGRYERKRFMLNGEVPLDQEIGEDTNVPFVANITYNLYPQGSVGFVLGCNINGKLSIDDVDGDLVYEKSYSPTFNTGLVASFRF